MSIRLRGTDIYISFSFLVMVCGFLMLDVLHSGWLILASIAVHELAHIVTMRCFGIRLEKLSLLPIGVRIEKCGGGTLSYKREAAIYLAGPLASLGLAVLCLCAGFQMGFGVNLLLAIFNMLPVMPLDGGQALFVLCKSFGDTSAAHKVSALLSALLLVPLGIGGIMLWQSADNISLLLTVLFLLSGLLPGLRQS